MFLNKAKNILAVRNDRFGEFLLNIPAFRALKARYPQSRLVVVVNPDVCELAQCIEAVDEVIAWRNKKHRLSGILKFAQELNKRKLDLCVIFNPSKEFNIVSFLARIPVKVGYNRKWGFLLTHKIEDKKYLGQKHEVEYNLELVNLIGADTQHRTLSLKIDESMIDTLLKDYGLEGISDLIALHPYTSDPIKQWPIDRFRELAQKISIELNNKVVIVGGKEELVKSEENFGNLDKRIINLTGKTTLVQLAALLKKCKLLISCDSGPVHLACSVGTPVIALFRNDIPGKSAKRWGPWGEGHTVVEKNNLYDISVDEVFNKIKERIDK